MEGRKKEGRRKKEEREDRRTGETKMREGGKKVKESKRK